MAFRATDLALFAARQRLQSQNLPQDDPAFRDYLRMLNGHLGYVRALYVIGADGFISHDTDYPKTPRVSLADRTYFQAFLNEPRNDVFIGNPVLSRSVKRWFMPVARRIDHSDGSGSFAGVVAAAVEPQFIERMYAQLQLGQNDSIALFHADSTLIARVPSRPDLYGRRLDELKLFTAMLPQSSSGVFPVRNVLTGRWSIVGYARLAEFPLIVTVAIDRSDALSAWTQQVWVIGLGCLSIIVLTALLHVILTKRMLERQVADQKALIREKLESIGYMTSSVAHDFRNLLAAIVAGVRLLRKRGPEEKILAGIEEAVARGDRLTTDLLQFARSQDVESSVFDPNAAIESLVTMIRQTISGETKLHIDLASDIKMVEASCAFFDAALINLVVNATHAMAEGGELCISTENRLMGRGLELQAGTYVVIRVSDTGQGIPPDKLESVFDPFVTSKGPKGTGLGLFQVRRFAVEAGGDVRIASKVGQGTTVEILLPVVAPSQGVVADGY